MADELTKDTSVQDEVIAPDDGATKNEPAAPKTITLGDILPEDMRGDKLPGSLKDFVKVALPGKDADEETTAAFHGKLGSVLKAYADTKRMVGGMIKIPGKDAKPEEVAAFRAKLGVPATPEDYKIEAPTFDDEEKSVMFSPELLDGFTKMAHTQAYTPKQVQAAVDFQAEIIKNQAKAMDKAAKDGIAALQTEYGDEYDSLMEGAELMVAKFFPKEVLPKIANGMGNDPDFARGLIAMYKATKEAGPLKGVGSSGTEDTVAAITDEIDKLMGSKEYQRNDRAVHNKVAALFVKKQQALGTYKESVRGSGEAK